MGELDEGGRIELIEKEVFVLHFRADGWVGIDDMVAVLANVAFGQTLQKMFCYNSISQYQNVRLHQTPFERIVFEI